MALEHTSKNLKHVMFLRTDNTDIACYYYYIYICSNINISLFIVIQNITGPLMCSINERTNFKKKNKAMCSACGLTVFESFVCIYKS